MVTDLRHLEPASPLDPLPPRVRHLRKFFGEIAWAASVRPSAEWSATPLRCRRRPGRKPCGGRLEVHRFDVPPEVEWRCPQCGDAGRVSGWRGSSWDLDGRPSTPSADPQGAKSLEIRVTNPEYDLLKDAMTVLESDSERIVAGARPEGPEHVLLTGPLDHWDFLAGEIAFEANHAESRRIRARFDALYERVVTAIEKVTGSPF